MTDSTDPQDLAEQLDEDVTNADPGDPEQNGLFSFAPDEPVAVDEELVTEPIVDSVASREARLEAEADLVALDDLADRAPDEFDDPDDLRSVLDADPSFDVGDLAGDPVALQPEEAALHVIDDANLG